DKRFCKHFGIDLIGIFRAIIINNRSKKRKQGASTITQQIYDIKREKKKLIRDRTYRRKVKQALYSLKIELLEEKHEILKYYLENVYLGKRYYGIENAAQGYFGKTLDLLKKEEIFFIIERIASPNKLLKNRVRTLLNRKIIKSSFSKYELKNLLDLYVKFQKGELCQKNNTKLV
ncbi:MULTISPECIES: biosynthetic peptidoglycan transglycosylase, partial [Psychrilyobacter]